MTNWTKKKENMFIVMWHQYINAVLECVIWFLHCANIDTFFLQAVDLLMYKNKRCLTRNNPFVCDHWSRIDYSTWSFDTFMRICEDLSSVLNKCIEVLQIWCNCPHLKYPMSYPCWRTLYICMSHFNT